MPLETVSSPQEALPPASPSLQENLETISLHLKRLEAEAADGSLHAYPDWWHKEAVSTTTIIDQLKDPAATPGSIPKYCEILAKDQELRQKITGHSFGDSPLASVHEELGPVLAARGFNTESLDGPMHTAMLKRLAEVQATENDPIVPELDLLREAYGLTSSTELLGLTSEDAYSHALQPLLRSNNALNTMRSVDSGQTPEDTVAEMRSKNRQWMTHALSLAAGLHETEAAGYTFASSQLGYPHNMSALRDTFTRFEQFGTERLSALAKFSGIHAFECYSPAQLELMESLIRNPREAAEQLAKHDVTVVMVNRVGDGGGAMKDTAEIFEDGRGRTLFFEINRMGDIYRHTLQLRDLGVRPSSLVLAAHSAPGQFMVSDKRDPALKRGDFADIAGRGVVELTNTKRKHGVGVFGYAMHGMKGMARMVEDFMQPSRSIDDSAENEGRKKIVFQACNAGTETDLLDLVGEDGHKAVVGTESVVGRIGNDLLANGVASNVDIYGGPDKVRLHKSPRGITYSSRDKTERDIRAHLPAVRIRLENGALTKRLVDEVILHKAA